MRRLATVALGVAALVARSPAPDEAPAGGSFHRVVAAQAAPVAATGVLTPARSPRNASYRLDARLDPAARAITGSASIAWRNITTRAADELQFHLYWNAWRNTQSTFLRERALSASVDRPAGDFSAIDITALRVNGSDLSAAMRFIAPDDGNEDDRTVMAVALPQAVAPGEEIVVEIQWTARVPRPFARTDTVGDYFFIAQWFPKLGVLEDEGWNTHQFHAATEFFADYGIYDVRLTVPSGWIVGATGAERERRDNGDGTATHRYYQEDVHDFAWTTSPDFVERRQRFEHPGLPPVEVRLLLQPGRASQAARHFRATAVALSRFGEWFGPYPYGHITVVDPAFRSESGGMEYPTLVTAGSHWWLPEAITQNGPEEVVIHEVGHQWFQGIVGTNEFEHAWMDEGITTYATARAMDDAYDAVYELRFFDDFVPWAFPDLPLRRETYWNRLAGYRNAAESDDPSMRSYELHPATGPYISYNKTALWLNTLERLIGWDTLRQALATYVERWQFRHPRPNDFFDVVNETAGRHLGWFFDQVYRTSTVFDYGIQRLTSSRDGDRYRTSVVVRRYGEAYFPVAVRVTFDDGESATEQWDGRGRWKLFTFERDARAVSAAVDPERVLLLDVNNTNNSRTLAPAGPAAARKWALQWMVWLEDALLTWAFFA